MQKHGLNSRCCLAAGMRFGKLTVVSYTANRGYLCKCECGGTTYARAYSLKSGAHSACSCGRTAPRPKAQLPQQQSAKNDVYRNYKAAARRRGHRFELTVKQFTKLILSDCTYCGAAPAMNSLVGPHKDFRYNGVDRIDNTLGYTVSNSVPCCRICNRAKATLTLAEWKMWIQRVHAKLFT